MDLENIFHFSTPNHAQITNMCPKRSPGEVLIGHETDKNGHLDPQVPIGCPRGSMDHRIFRPGYPKWSLEVAKIIVWDIKSDPSRGTCDTVLDIKSAPLWATKLRGICFESSKLTSFNQSKWQIVSCSLAICINIASLRLYVPSITSILYLTI